MPCHRVVSLATFSLEITFWCCQVNWIGKPLSPFGSKDLLVGAVRLWRFVVLDVFGFGSSVGAFNHHHPVSEQVPEHRRFAVRELEFQWLCMSVAYPGQL